MAGVRLAIHATFVVELLILVTCSFLYATNKPHDASLSAEPFLADQSGWKILVEDVSPAPSSSSTEGNNVVGRIIEQVGEISTALLNQIYSLMGVEFEHEKMYHHKPRRDSSFVQEIRQQIATIPGARSIDEEVLLPPLRFNLQMPQVISSATLNSLADSLAKGLQSQTKQSTYVPLIKVGVAAESKQFSTIDNTCDNSQLYNVETKPNINKREVEYPEIIILMGCTNSANIPDEQMISVEVDRNSGILIVRTKLSVDNTNELQHYLENEIPRKIVSNIFASRTPSKSYKLQSVSINLIDEDPSSYVTDETRSLGYTAKSHFDMIGKALSSCVESKISPLLEELAFVYGGRIEGVVGSDATDVMIISNNAIGLQVHSSAFVPIPNVPSLNSNFDQDGEGELKLVSSDVMANWLHKTQPKRRNSNGDDTIPDYVEWNLLVPAAEHAPLVMFSDVGESMSIVDKTENDDVYPNGLSIVNLPSFSTESHAVNGDLDQVYQRYKDVISNSLEYLVGCIRAIHGLPAISTILTQHAEGGKSQQQAFSFWELESIARSQYSRSLDIALHEMDVLLAVLYQHQSTLAFPVEVAYKLNNATHLLRQSISLIEQGYPTIYATSLIHGSLQYIESVQSDHRFHELPYFAIDHYLAVFSPLVLPLLLPMIAGLVREIKRFRELKKKNAITP